jgi:hypothetical protein
LRNLIECGTRGGFHTSFGRGDPCTRYPEKKGIPEFGPSPDARRERRPLPDRERLLR